MPITIGKSLAFSGQSSAAMVPAPETTITASDNASDERLCTGPLPGTPELGERIEHDPGRDGEQQEHERAQQPRSVVARDGDVQIVFSDLAENEPENERRTRVAGAYHEVAHRSGDQRYDEVGVARVRRVAADEDQHQDHRDQEVAGQRSEA